MACVVDASAVVLWLLDGTAPLADGTWVSHEGLDVEVLSVLRRHVLLERLDPHEALETVDFFAALQIERHPFTRVMRRAWALRHDITSYDAGYVALAEALGLPLVTADRKLARTARRYCDVVVL